MTDQQLKQAQELKRIIAVIEGELEKCGKHLPSQGINVFLPNVGTLIEDVRQVFVDHLSIYNKKFKEL
jgi:hypothetical protein